jgi:hypothetical protein
MDLKIGEGGEELTLYHFLTYSKSGEIFLTEITNRIS